MQLYDAAAKGDTEEVSRLIAQGANVNAKNEIGGTGRSSFSVSRARDGFTAVRVPEMSASEPALTVASRNGRTDVVRVLLANGADVNIEDDKGDTVLIWTGNKPMKEMIVTWGQVPVRELLQSQIDAGRSNWWVCMSSEGCLAGSMSVSPGSAVSRIRGRDEFDWKPPNPEEWAETSCQSISLYSGDFARGEDCTTVLPVEGVQ